MIRAKIEDRINIDIFLFSVINYNPPHDNDGK